MLWKYTLAWVPMIFIAIINGMIRQFVYGPQMTELAAHQISCATGVILFFLYALIVSGRLPLANAGQAWFVGVIWLVLTIAFEFGFGLFIAGHSLGRLLHDYHIAEGRLWLIVLICLFLMPYTVFQIRRRQKRPQKISASTKSP